MAKRKLEIAVHIFNVIFISAFLVIYINWDYPRAGHDYSYFIPNLLDNYLHYTINGLAIQWYTPSFGGGMPSYPNPQQVQFSLPELLTLLVDPWGAALIATVAFALVGYFGMYYLLTHSLSLSWQAGILGGLFFTANGFFIERMSVGHLTFQTFPLLAVLVVVLMDLSLPRGLAGLILALMIALMIYQGSFFLIVTFALSLLMIIPLVYVYRSEVISWKHLGSVAALGGSVALVFSASKVAAVFAFMRLFPRLFADSYPATGLLKGLLGIALQLLGTMNLAPLFKLIGPDPVLLLNAMRLATGAHYGYWEFDMSLSPIVIGIIFFGVYSLLREPKKYSNLFVLKKKWIAWVLLIFFTWLTIEFTLAKGLLYPLLQKLPILGSLHVNPRFAAAFLFPLALSAALIYHGWAAKWSTRRSVLIFLVADLLTLVPLCSYFMIKTGLQDRSYDLTGSHEIYRLIRSGDTLAITGIVSGVTNTEALLLRQSNLEPYEAIFGYLLESFHPEIVPGSIWDISDGYYNLTNPSGYVFPELNGTRPFERIPVSGKARLETFASHGQPDWKIPLYQQMLDRVSGVTVLAGTFFLSFVGIKRLITCFRPRGKVVSK